MPFDYKEFSAKCDSLTVAELQDQWHIYTRHISGGATSTTLSVSFAPFTAGASLIGLGLSTPRIHNARKKRAIIETHLQALGAKHDTRKRDVLGSMALSGAVGGLTLGLAPPGAEAVAEYGAMHAVQAIVENPHTVEAAVDLTADGVGTAGEQALEVRHEKEKKKEKAMKKLRKMASAQDVQMQRAATPPPPYAGHEKEGHGTSLGAVERDESDEEEDVSMEEMEELLKGLVKEKQKKAGTHSP